jgi:hypothetical protein
LDIFFGKFRRKTLDNLENVKEKIVSERNFFLKKKLDSVGGA